MSYDRQKAAAKRMLTKRGILCTLHKPATTTPDPDKPWDVSTDPTVDFPDVACVFFPTDFRYDTSSGYWPDSIVPEAREVAYVAADHLPQSEEIKAGWKLTKPNGSEVSVLRVNVIAPDSTNKILYIAQVSG